MPLIPDAVPENALDYDEILSRGGRNFGDEDFALTKCPECGQIYLFEYEVDTMYVNAENLGEREDLCSITQFNCPKCCSAFPRRPWIGPKAPAEMQVKWDELASSPWRWITERTRITDLKGASDFEEWVEGHLP